MKLEDFLVMIGLKLLVMGYLENTLRYTTPFKNSENSVMTQALIYLSNSFVVNYFIMLSSDCRKYIAKLYANRGCFEYVRECTSPLMRRIPLLIRTIQPDQFISKWFARLWWVLVKISRNEYFIFNMTRAAGLFWPLKSSLILRVNFTLYRLCQKMTLCISLW